jgi:hypothetical protein
MATKVYLNGKTIEIEKAGDKTLSILVAYAKYTIIGTIPVNTIEDYTQVLFTDIRTDETIIDDTIVIQDSSGGTFSTNYDLKAYLDTFFVLADAKVNAQQGATKENQDLLIIQNALLQEELEKLNLSNEDLERIKELLKTNNKLLNKIYQ